jgi:hypothetical protein
VLTRPGRGRAACAHLGAQPILLVVGHLERGVGGEPALEQVAVDLGVELQAPRAPVAKGLLLGDVARRELCRAFRQVVDVDVPREDPSRLAQVSEHGVIEHAVGRRDRHPSALEHARRPDVRPERAREQLASEADAEHGHVIRHRIT